MQLTLKQRVDVRVALEALLEAIRAGQAVATEEELLAAGTLALHVGALALVFEFAALSSHGKRQMDQRTGRC